MEEKWNEICVRVADYAKQRSLEQTEQALAFVKQAVENGNPVEQGRYQAAMRHALETCRMLIDLHLPIDGSDEDSLLAAVILHVYPGVQATELPRLLERLGYGAETCDIVSRIAQNGEMPDEEQQLFYTRAQEHPLALLAALAARGNVVRQLHRVSTWNAHRYIEETKICYYPMAIYGKERYHHLLAPISVLLEKIRTLVEVAEILLRRYEERENELIQDIMSLREENAILKGIIANFSE